MDRLERLKQVQEEVQKDRSLSLPINRVPEPTRSEFIKLANERFAGDYGMTLLYLYDVSMNFAPQIEHLKSFCIELEQRISAVENAEPEKKTIKTLNGKIIELGGK